MDDDDRAFFDQDGDAVIKGCFDAVHDGNHITMLPDRFRDFVLNAVSGVFQWPSTAIMGNAYSYLIEQYVTNVTTNLTTHCERRLKSFFRMRVFEWNDINPNVGQYNDIDVTNAVN